MNKKLKFDKYTLSYRECKENECPPTYTNIINFYLGGKQISLNYDRNNVTNANSFTVCNILSECIDVIYRGEDLRTALIKFYQQIRNEHNSNIIFISDKDKSICSSLTIEEIVDRMLLNKHIVKDELINEVRVVTLFQPGVEKHSNHRFMSVVDDFHLFHTEYSNSYVGSLQTHEKVKQSIENHNTLCKKCIYYYGRYLNDNYLHCTVKPYGLEEQICNEYSE